MNILGFSCSEVGDWHDSSAAIVCDGRLVAAAEEERFSRKKHDGAFPLKAIEYCLREAGLQMRDIDVIAFPDVPYRYGRDSYIAQMDPEFVQRLRNDGRAGRSTAVHHRLASLTRSMGLPLNFAMYRGFAGAFTSLREHFGAVAPVHFYDHHRSHAAAAYLTSGREAAAVVTLDGVGGPYSCVAWKAEGERLTRLRAEPYYNSLGLFYRDCTRYLGFGDYGEGKAMGLAPYGDPQPFASRVRMLLDQSDASWFRYLQKPDPATVGFPARSTESVMESKFINFAAAFQQALEAAIFRVTQWTMNEVGSRNLCLGGGVGLNCSANGKLMRAGVTEHLSIFPAAGDGGLTIGAALLCASEVGELQRSELHHAYWGPSFSESAYREALEQESRVVYRRSEELSSDVAAALADGKVVGWFQGKMELGPRALGNRSILADPRTVEIRDRVNGVKRRELWRPLAPVVLAEHATEYFDLVRQTPFMLQAAEVRAQVRATVPAIVHVDFTARPQTVRRDQNERLYGLISAFHRISGVPILLNTSFNSEMEPIVCSPENAIATYLSTGMDILVLGDFIVQRADQPRLGSR